MSFGKPKDKMMKTAQKKTIIETVTEASKAAAKEAKKLADKAVDIASKRASADFNVGEQQNTLSYSQLKYDKDYNDIKWFFDNDIIKDKGKYCTAYLTCDNGNKLLNAIKEVVEKAKKDYADAKSKAARKDLPNEICNAINEAYVTKSTMIKQDHELKEDNQIDCMFGNNQNKYIGVTSRGKITSFNLAAQTVDIRLYDDEGKSKKTKKTVYIKYICVGGDTNPYSDFACREKFNKTTALIPNEGQKEQDEQDDQEGQDRQGGGSKKKQSKKKSKKTKNMKGGSKDSESDYGICE